VRSHGLTEFATWPGTHEHLCWTYVSHDEFLDAAVTFLVDGIAAGLRVMYVAESPAGELREHVAPVGDVDQLCAAGTLILQPLDDVYDVDANIVPEQQLAAYAAATDQALAGGYTGLRVVAEVTRLVANPAGRAEFARWEHLADRYMVDHPLSAMCAYDRRILGDDGVADAAAQHPIVHAPRDVVPFRAFHRSERLVVIEGRVDEAGAPAFDRAMSHLPDSDRTVTVDLSDAELVGDHALRVIAKHASRRARFGATLILHGS
jgi:hypothetical protein